MMAKFPRSIATVLASAARLWQRRNSIFSIPIKLAKAIPDPVEQADHYQVPPDQADRFLGSEKFLANSWQVWPQIEEKQLKVGQP